MADMTDEALDKLVTRLKIYEELGPLSSVAIHPETPGYTTGGVLGATRQAAATITDLRQRETTAVAGAIEAAAMVADEHARPLNEKAVNCGHRGDEFGEAVFESAMSEANSIATAIRAMNADATRAALDRVKAEGMREAAEIAHRMALTDANMNRTWRAGCEDVAEAIHRAADKLEGKS